MFSWGIKRDQWHEIDYISMVKSLRKFDSSHNLKENLTLQIYMNISCNDGF